MTNDERTERIATEIMGWKIGTPNKDFPGVIDGGNIWVSDIGLVYDSFDQGGYWHEWNPRTRWDHAGMLEAKLGECGFWLELKSPFFPGQPYFAGFTPHNTTGWNGVPDNKRAGDTGPAAIFEAAYATLEEI